MFEDFDDGSVLHPNLYPIRRVKTIQDFPVIFLSYRPSCIHEHWDGSRTIPCNRKSSCPICSSGKHPRYVSYQWVVCVRNSRVEILHLPGTTTKSLVDQMRQTEGSWRGTGLVLKRESTSLRSKLLVSIVKYDPTKGIALPEPPPLESILISIWGLNTI